MYSRGTYLAILFLLLRGYANGEDTIRYETHVRPLLERKCIQCHNTNGPKGGVNIDNYKEQDRVIKDGQFWLKILDQIKTRDMPPKQEPPLSESDYQDLVNGINTILQNSLKEKSPGRVVIRRLSHSQYHYTILDLLNVNFDAQNYFPSDGSGGGGFDNQARALFFTPLKLERYYDAADRIIEEVINDENKWVAVVPIHYKQNWLQRFGNWAKAMMFKNYKEFNAPVDAAEKTIVPFATKAYRRFLKAEEKIKLIGLFQTVYDQKDSLDNPRRFNESIAQVYKSILVSPHFLYRTEEEPEKTGSYPLNNFEVATRISYFLWSSLPDQELFDLAYTGKLDDTLVIEAQVRRMLADPKSKRLAESFSVQWLGITKLIDNQPMADPELFPDFDQRIRQDLYQEAIEYFYYVMTKSKNLQDLIHSNYALLNNNLAEFYGIEGVTGDQFQKTTLADTRRGGVLGMGSVLSTTSFPLRTSPVLRGKWVMEQLLGISAPPPPPVVAELTADKATHEALGLRKILEAHRANPECQSCHEKMDPLGLGLENFDPVGRWRERYEKVPIDPSGVLSDGRPFQGPDELKKLLLTEQSKFARNISSKMLSYALGRSILFTDEPALAHLEATLLNNHFDPELFIIELVKSYPFRMKLNDFEKKDLMKKNWHISRRRMLKGVGACVALPFLEAMAIPGLKSTPSVKSPVRAAFLFMPNGVHPDQWTPVKTGSDFTLTRQLLPLESLKRDINVLGELMNRNSIFKGADGHYAKSASLLTCMPIKQTIGDNISSGGVSLDQFIATRVGKETLFPSLEYGMDRITTGVDINVGFTRLYGSSISWKTPHQPMSKEIDPRLAFDRLFRSHVPGVKIKEDPWKQSILDVVLEDATSLRKNLGRADQDKLTEYLESIRSVEKQISNRGNLEKFAANITPDIRKELVRVNASIDEYIEKYTGVDVTQKTRLMMDIMALAFWSDASRVSTFMFGNSVSDRNFSFLEGVKGNHHSISHHMDKKELMDEYARIATWHVEQYAYLLGKLKSIKEGDKTLLENSMVVFASDLRDGNRHSPRNLPILLGGQGGGRIKTGQNLIFDKETPLANLYLTMLQAMNIDQSEFGDSTGILNQIRA